MRTETDRAKHYPDEGVDDSDDLQDRAAAASPVPNSPDALTITDPQVARECVIVAAKILDEAACSGIDGPSQKEERPLGTAAQGRTGRIG